MPRAHCLDCGDSVVIDPSGRCAEGHEVGAPGERIEGSLGSAVPHPDEPEPWVARLEFDVAVTPAPVAVRAARPPAAPPAPPPGRASDPGPSAAAAPRSEELLRELHSLGDVGKPCAPPAPPTATPPPSPPTATLPTAPHTSTPPTAAAAAPPPPVAAVEPTLASAPAAPTAPSPSTVTSERSSIDDLSALEAAVQALNATNGHRPAPVSAPVPAPSPAPAPTASVSAQLDDLFAAADLGTGNTPPLPPVRPAPADHAPVSTPHEPDAPERWAVLADVAAFAEEASEPAPPMDVPAPPASVQAVEPPAAAPSAPADRGIDLGNFTASGKRVGAGAKGKRRLFGR